MVLGGKKKKKGKKKPQNNAKRKLRFPDVGENYAQIKKLLGDCRLEVYIPGEGMRKAKIPGRFRKRVWINRDDWVIIQYRECDGRKDSACDILHVYKLEEVRKLQKLEEIPVEKCEEEKVDDLEFFEVEEKNEKHLKQEIEYPSSFTSSEEWIIGEEFSE
jgi:translation initiation factor 1A